MKGLNSVYKLKMGDREMRRHIYRKHRGKENYKTNKSMGLYSTLLIRITKILGRPLTSGFSIIGVVKDICPQ